MAKGALNEVQRQLKINGDRGDALLKMCEQLKKDIIELSKKIDDVVKELKKIQSRKDVCLPEIDAVSVEDAMYLDVNDSVNSVDSAKMTIEDAMYLDVNDSVGSVESAIMIVDLEIAETSMNIYVGGL